MYTYTHRYYKELKKTKISDGPSLSSPGEEGKSSNV